MEEASWHKHLPLFKTNKFQVYVHYTVGQGVPVKGKNFLSIFFKSDCVILVFTFQGEGSFSQFPIFPVQPHTSSLKQKCRYDSCLYFMFTFHVLSISEREAIQKNSQLRKTEVQKYFKICEIYKIYILVKTLILVGNEFMLL